MATHHDLVELARMVTEARHATSRAEGLELLGLLSGTDDDIAAGLRRRLDGTKNAVCVGEYEGVVAGFGSAQLWESDTGGAPLAVVVALYVDPGFRRVGVGETIIGFLEAWARRSGAHGLDVIALPGSRDAKSLLEALGYKARALLMHRRLDDADG